MVNRRIAMRFGERSLGHLSLVFGLLAVGTLSLSVATDFWLFTVEALDPSMLLGDMTTPVVNPYAPPLETADDMPSDAVYSDYNDLNETGGMEDMGSEIDMNMYPIVFAKLHSGLWRSCQYYDNQDLEVKRPVCTTIEYFGQDSERPPLADTTNSILRAIRKSSPVIVGSLVILVTALTFSILGNTKHDVKTLIAAILYISGALSLAVGVIFYISAVNDEVSHRKKAPSSSTAGFTYRYGWAFFFAGASFMCAMVAAVNNISLYLRRGIDSHETDDHTTSAADSATMSGEKHSLSDWRQQQYLRHANITTPV